ncbi:hypothetical protein [Streptomyces pacificus]|uniref:Uncharacterized protein n=1 Tax=Streptomyces pacificus TaxID=2705029 RepID=A0A6A0AUM4_9ACTN|nr:hypothetical protein [Streptomyces pacificus]GFH36630.1 hypothetical protein SCWH03_28610 [Streptomyces pacificus]
MSLTSTLALAAFAEQTSTLDLGSAASPVRLQRSVQLASGTGAGQADLVFSDRRTISASGAEDLDLAGVLLDAFGATITFARVKGLFISASANNANNVVVGADATNPWATLLNAAGTVTLRPGASFAAVAGATDSTAYAVTAGTGDLLQVANSAGGTSVTYDVVVIGASA